MYNGHTLIVYVRYYYINACNSSLNFRNTIHTFIRDMSIPLLSRICVCVRILLLLLYAEEETPEKCDLNNNNNHII